MPVAPRVPTHSILLNFCEGSGTRAVFCRISKIVLLALFRLKMIHLTSSCHDSGEATDDVRVVEQQMKLELMLLLISCFGLKLDDFHGNSFGPVRSFVDASESSFTEPAPRLDLVKEVGHFGSWVQIQPRKFLN